jgi:hypothetical protein
MIQLFLSSDGKHTVHVSADTPEQMAELAPQAKALYEAVLEQFGTKAQMWEEAINRKGNGQAQVGKRIDTVEQAREAVAPRCVVHQHVPMVQRQGPYGTFWSCPARKPDGSLCRITQGVYPKANGQAAVS